MLLHAGTVLDEPAVYFAGAAAALGFAVDDDGVERLLGQQGFHFFDIHRGDDFGSGADEDVALKFEHCFFALDEQDASGKRCFATGRGRGFLFSCAFSRGWKNDFNYASAVRPIVGADLSAMLLDDAVANAQAEAGAFAHALSGVEGLEDAVWFLDAGPGIVEFGVDVSVFDIDTNLQRAALAGFEHGVHGVVDDVEKDL